MKQAINDSIGFNEIIYDDLKRFCQEYCSDF